MNDNAILVHPGESVRYVNPTTGKIELHRNDTDVAQVINMPGVRRAGGLGNFAGKAFRHLGLALTAPVRYPWRAAKGWVGKVKQDAFQWLWGPVLATVCLGALSGMIGGIYYEKVVKCEQAQFTGLVEEVTPLDGDYLMVRFKDGPAFKIYTATGKTMPAVGIGGYVCQRGRFHALQPEPAAAADVEIEAEDF